MPVSPFATVTPSLVAGGQFPTVHRYDSVLYDSELKTRRKRVGNSPDPALSATLAPTESEMKTKSSLLDTSRLMIRAVIEGDGKS